MKISKKILFAKGGNYKTNITVPMIHSYYNSVLPKIVDELEDNQLQLLNGIEAVKTLKESEPFSIVHISPNEGLDDSIFREIISAVAQSIQGLPDITSLQIYFDGNKGFSLYPYFDAPRNLATTNSMVSELIKSLLDEHTSEVKSQMFNAHQRIRLPYSINKNTGLAMVPVEDISKFTNEDAKITKFISASYQILDKKSCDVPAIGIDFDNTLFLPYGEDYYKGSLNESVAELAHYAKKAGYKVIIFTARVIDHPEDMDFIVQFLQAHNVPFDEITPIKKPAIKIIIDDKAVTP